MSDTWSYSTGKWGYNRVRVYEREPGQPLQVVWTGGKRQTLANVNGEPIYDRGLAREVADEIARQMDRGKRKRQARDILGLPEQHTLAELVEKYHASSKARKWSATHRRHQETIRDWWLSVLGPSRNLRPAPVEDVEEAVDRVKEWSPRTQQKYLRYIVAAYNYARVKLKWITEQDDLRPVEIPDPQSKSYPYSQTQVFGILEAAPKVDLRLSVACELLYMTGRRIGPVRQARSDGYRVEGEYGVVPFPARTDKARKEAEVYITGTTRERVEMLLQRPLVQSSGWLLPDGDLGAAGKAEPLTYDQLLGLLRKAEKIAGVPYVKRRGFHGFKRRYATMTKGRAGAGQQAGTDPRTLHRIYEQDDPAAKMEIADELEALRCRA